jgi:translation elongation factor EF-Ts
MSDNMTNARKVMEIRRRTGERVLDCQRALNAANGDIEEAIRTLAKRYDGPSSRDVMDRFKKDLRSERP